MPVEPVLLGFLPVLWCLASACVEWWEGRRLVRLHLARSAYMAETSTHVTLRMGDTIWPRPAKPSPPPLEDFGGRRKPAPPPNVSLNPWG